MYLRGPEPPVTLGALLLIEVFVENADPPRGPGALLVDYTSTKLQPMSILDEYLPLIKSGKYISFVINIWLIRDT